MHAQETRRSTQHQQAIATWLARTEKYAADLPEGKLCDAFTSVCSGMVAANDLPRIDRLLAMIKDREKRVEQSEWICDRSLPSGKV